ncbi:CDP-6-deoxy-delta-3,4-glucoseen reductase [Silvimonas iriomotensis]|uniref:CDP-6-deoxy-delta-3,4-glucoseen reductase n=1 Tax=Silvimonas iriomotensis TaxID=449662 RepID=A0ABQ2P8F9_9NEIS|nr:CDP-6-deoxy-delta-3,4-glucoseen reductase [Silvimonas iriomotensis]GGP20811.1 CDP-6-deoxy-delta-3,4-glucoseen reductase [Silvimonas iriomotensis]
MSKQLTILPSGQQIALQEGQTILDAAIGAGFSMPYGCKNGACGACKGQVVQGQVEYPDGYAESALTHMERERGLALYCCAVPTGDITVECREVSATKDIQIKTLPCRVQKIEKVSHDVAVLSFKLPTTERLQFLAGQYIDLHTNGGKKRSFSIANAPHDDEYLQLHIRCMPGGEFASYVWNEMKEREIMRFTGPLGSFFLREDSEKPIIFVATGTGFAPIKGILEHAFNKGIDRQMILYWGARSQRDLYMPELPQQWAKDHPNFKYIPVLSEPAPEDNWTGRTGFVHESVLEDFGSMASWQVYACGAPVMVEAAYKNFVARGLPEDEFFSDAFFSSKDTSKPAA